VKRIAKWDGEVSVVFGKDENKNKGGKKRMLNGERIIDNLIKYLKIACVLGTNSLFNGIQTVIK